MPKNKSDKKRKHDKVEASDSAPTGGFSLFGAAKEDAELDSVFAKSAAFAIPEEPKTAAAAAAISAASEPTDEPARKKAMKAKAKVEAEAAAASAKAEASKSKKEAKKASKAAEKPEAAEEDEGEGEGSEAESVADLVHESLKTPSQRRERSAKGSAKYIPPGETSADRDRRTVFVGNLPIEASGQSGTRALKRHLLTFAVGAKIDSVRFRSVAFSTPTAGADKEKEDAKVSKDEKEEEKTRREARDAERVAAWKANQAAGSSVGGRGNRRGDDEVVDKSKSFLDKSGKRKVAFIKKDFHSDADTCNAYVVFAHPHPERAANVAPITDPYEAATLAIKADGSELLGRVIHVDGLRLPSAIGLASASNNLGKRDAWLPAGTDPKASLFVGGLDYAAKDDDVRAHFEALVTAERGPAPEDKGGKWVTGVRIVRDRDTQMGKGFGYVHFVDRESVDEMISLPSQKLKFAKKPLRVQAARTLPPTTKKVAPAAASAGQAQGKGKGKETKTGGKKEKTTRTAPAVMPKGDPSLGDRLKNLSKDERKAAKSADAERLARRMAKKANKVAGAHRETGAVKLAATKAEKGLRNKKVKAKKSRVRSGAQATKMKGKRGD